MAQLRDPRCRKSEEEIALLGCGQPYLDEGAEAYEKRYQQSRIRSLTARAKEMGYQLTPITV